MALIQQSDIGNVAGANAYISVADFKLYHTDSGNDFSAYDSQASDVLTTTGAFVNGETVTLAGKVYTLQTTLTNVDGNVQIVAGNTPATLTNLAHAINASGGVSGTDYAALTVASTYVTAANDSSTLTVTAIGYGTPGNNIVVSSVTAHATWATANLSGGKGSDALVASAIVRATKYMDSRFQFIGVKLVTTNVQATSALNATANFNDTETVTIGAKTYTFQMTLTNADGHVHIGLTRDLSVVNLVNAINASGGGVPGTDYALASVPDFSVTASAPSPGSMMVLAITAGISGNSIAVSQATANATWTSATLLGGMSPQSTQWPRAAGSTNFVPWFDVNFLTPVIFDSFDGMDSFVAVVGPDNNKVLGIPQAVRDATAEYALRALSIPLFQDMPSPVGGRSLVSQTIKVDTIEQSTEWSPMQSGGFFMPAYPIADLMLARAGLINASRVILR